MCSIRADACKALYEGAIRLCISIVLLMDTMSVFTALSAATVRPPAEKTLGILLHWIKEK